MKTITMNIDEHLLSQLEERARVLDTTVDDVVTNLLRQWAQADAINQARQIMSKRFQQADWKFAVGSPDSREQRNARS